MHDDQVKGDILIVDDSQPTQHVLSRLLTEQGYAVRSASDGPTALRVAEAQPPDLILLDVRMPGMDGYEVCQQLKSADQTRDIPVIFISALGLVEDKVKGFEAGGEDFVTKPLQGEEILARLKTHLALRNAQKSLEEKNAQLQREIAERVQAEEALRRYTERLGVLREIDQGILAAQSPESIAQAAVTRIRQLIPCRRASVGLFDFASNEMLTLAVDADTKSRQEENTRYQLDPLEDQVKHLRQGQVVVWRQAQSRGSNIQNTSAAKGLGSFVSVALISQNELIGALNLGFEASKPRFTQEHRAIARQVADQLAIAIQQARLYEQVQRRVDELVFLEHVGRTVTSSLDLEQILATVMEKTALVLKAEACSILLLDKESKELVFRAAAGPRSDKVKGLRMPLGQGIAGQVIQQGRPLLAHNVKDDPHFYPDIDASTGFITRSVLAVPLEVKEKAIGVIEAMNKATGNFGQTDVKLLSSIARWAAIAIENVQLMEQASETQILRELDRLQSELIANVSHELRTPLGLIKIFATSLQREETSFDREIRQRFLHGIEDETDKLEEIVDNLLDLGRLDSERLRLDKQPTDLGELAERVLETMRAQFVGHRFMYDFPPAPLVARVDAQRVEQVLRNFLTNAIKYSPVGGAIAVQGYQDEGEVLISVSDEGIGIPSQEQEKIFERFYRVDNKVTRRVRGAGLGLSVCQGIIEAHEGRIWFESTPGAGSTFYCLLPVGDQENKPQIAQKKT